jgi:hypothetical protein
MVYVRAAEPMARVLKRARGKISLACGIQCCPIIFKLLLPDQRLYTMKNTCIHTHTYLTSYRLYMNCRWYQITLQWNIFTQIRSGAICWLDIYYSGVGLEVNGRIRDIGQNVLESSSQTGSSSSPSYCHIFFFILYHEQAFIKNVIIIILLINYVIITFINHNNVVINNLLKTPRLCSAHQNSHGHTQEFLRNIVYRQFGNAPCKRFASPSLLLTTLEWKYFRNEVNCK